MSELNDEQLDSLQVDRVNDEEGVNIHGDAVIIDGAPRVWVTTERMSPIYLTRDDIYDLGFLRSNPERRIYQHKDKPELYLQEFYEKDYSVKDQVIVRVEVFDMKWVNSVGGYIQTVYYNTNKPNKVEIEQVIKNYAA